MFFKSPFAADELPAADFLQTQKRFWKFLEAKKFLVGQLSEKWNSRLLQQTLSAAAAAGQGPKPFSPI
jgi:hypothetical protein